MTAVKWMAGLLFLLVLAAGGCAALYGMSERADPPDIDWQTVTPAEVETLIESGELDPNEEFWWNERTDYTPLMAVVNKKGNVDVLDVLIEHGADIHWHTGEENLNMTPLDLALHSGSIEHARRLLELGADPVRAGSPTPPVFYPLIAAGLKTDLRKQVIDLLLNYGADINGLDTSNGENNIILTPFMQAVAYLSSGNEEIAENYAELLSYLISRGADINMIPENSYVSAMRFAVFSRNTELTENLIALGGDVNLINDNDNYTPVAYFIQTGQNIEIFDLLVDAGADLDYVFPDGASILDVIKYRKQGGELSTVFYQKFYAVGGLIDFDKFPTERSWLDFADEITARIEDLCEETPYTICDELETI